MKTVFISSTGHDLKEYREAARDVCIAMGFAVTMMESWEAMSVGATKGSLKKLKKCDLYIGIFAHRYGYCESGYRGKSITEIEFDTAGDILGLDRLCFIVDPKFAWPADAIEIVKTKKMVSLKKKVERKLIVSYFTTVDNFKFHLTSSLSNWIADLPEANDKAIVRTHKNDGVSPIQNLSVNPFVVGISVLAAIATIIGLMLAIVNSSGSTNTPSFPTITAATISNVSVVPSATHSITSTSTQPSSPTIDVTTLTIASSPTEDSLSPYYIDHAFGCLAGTQWRFDKNSCRGVQLEIYEQDSSSNSKLMTCIPHSNTANCPSGIPLTELSTDLEWRFKILTSGGTVLIRPTVIVGNSKNGELARSSCTLGRQDVEITPTENDINKWYKLEQTAPVNVYCPLSNVYYGDVEWAIALVDYDIEGLRYFISQPYGSSNP